MVLLVCKLLSVDKPVMPGNIHMPPICLCRTLVLGHVVACLPAL